MKMTMNFENAKLILPREEQTQINLKSKEEMLSCYVVVLVKKKRFRLNEYKYVQ